MPRDGQPQECRDVATFSRVDHMYFWIGEGLKGVIQASFSFLRVILYLSYFEEPGVFYPDRFLWL